MDAPQRREPGVYDQSDRCVGGLSDADSSGLEGYRRDERSDEPGRFETNSGDYAGESRPENFWSQYDLLPFKDGKTRRIEPGTFPLVAGIPRGMVHSGHKITSEYAQKTGEARKIRLKGYGNSIVPQVAATFIRAAIQ